MKKNLELFFPDGKIKAYFIRKVHKQLVRNTKLCYINDECTEFIETAVSFKLKEIDDDIYILTFILLGNVLNEQIENDLKNL